jgi:hypothetical protein
VRQPLGRVLHTSHTAIAISPHSKDDQISAKSPSGGFSRGFTSPEYQAVLCELKIDETSAMPKHKISHPSSASGAPRLYLGVN